MSSEVESKDVRAEFQRIARSHRKRKRVELSVVLPVVVLTAVVWVYLPAPYSYLAGACFVASIFVAALFAPKLVCPVCQKDPSSRLDRFCPACGSASISEKERKMGALPACSVCGKKLWRSKRGSGVALYLIHFCTHCGSYLDEEGV